MWNPHQRIEGRPRRRSALYPVSEVISIGTLKQATQALNNAASQVVAEVLASGNAPDHQEQRPTTVHWATPGDMKWSQQVNMLMRKTVCRHWNGQWQQLKMAAHFILRHWNGQWQELKMAAHFTGLTIQAAKPKLSPGTASEARHSGKIRAVT
jgi:hypothetical protein